MVGNTEVIHDIACGLDVHSAVIAACLARSGPQGGVRYEERSFATTLAGLSELREWLLSNGCEVVGMEATGVYWMPVYAALEQDVQVVVGNPSHMKNLRGHKTDRKDAKWIVGLVRHDLIRPSFVPPPEFRDARELTRFRKQLIQARTAIRNEVQRLLSRQGIPLSSVLSNVFGASGMAILEALAGGRSVLQELPKLIHRSVRKKLDMLSAALESPLGEISRYLLTLQLQRLEEVERKIQDLERKIEAHLKPYQDKLERLMTIPGVSRVSACIILAELGIDMSRWPTEKHLAAWGGVAPGCRESGGRAHKAATRKGNPHLCNILVECAGAAVKVKGCYLGGKYRHLSAQTGSKKKARMAIARKLLVIVYRILGDGATYQEPNPRDLPEAIRRKAIQRHLRELTKLGLHAELTLIPEELQS